MSLTNLTLDLAIGFNGLAKQYGSDCTVWLTKTQPVLKWNTASSTSIHAEYAQADLDSAANVKCLCEMRESCVASIVKKCSGARAPLPALSAVRVPQLPHHPHAHRPGRRAERELAGASVRL